jgi:hypothetical protein
MEEPLNERIEAGQFEQVEVIPVYEFANKRAVYMF